MSYATDRAKARSMVPCTRDTQPCVNVYVDVSCNPTIIVDISHNPIFIDISYNPVLKVDISYNPVFIDVSYNSVLKVDISYNPVFIDISYNPVLKVDISYNPVIFVDISHAKLVLDLSGTNQYLATLTNMDAFGRLRVSDPYTLFEFNSIAGKGDSGQGVNIIDEEVFGSATSTWMPQSYVDMNVSGVGYVIRQSHEYIVYQPGKSKLVMMTGVLFHTGSPYNQTDITARIGPFDASMGVYVEYNGSEVAIIEKNVVSGTYNRIPRTQWNLDKLHGAGPCPYDISFNKAQIYVFDFEWLGVGRVRCGVVVGGKLYYYHEFRHINELEFPYIRTAKLPLRYEIIGGEGSRNAMHMICGTVISEGGFSPLTRTFWYPTATSLLTIGVPNDSNWHPLISFRIRNSYPSRYGTMKFKNIDVVNSDNSKAGMWQLVVGGSSSNWTPTWAPYDVSASIVEIATNTDNSKLWSGGKVYATNFYSGRVNSVQFTSTDELIQAPSLCYRNINPTGSDVATIIFRNLTSGAADNVYVAIQWIEIM